MLSTITQSSTMPLSSMLPLHTPQPLLITPQPLMLSLPMLMSLTPTPTELLMTIPRLTSTLLRLLMLPVLYLDLTMLLFPTAVPSMSSTPPTTTTDMLLRLPMTVSLSTLRLLLMLPPLPTMLKPSLCFVNIYQQYLLKINKKQTLKK